MPNIVSWAAAGLDAIHVGYRNADGVIVGFANLTASNTDTASSMRRLKGAQTAPLAIPGTDKVNIAGDNTRIASFQFASVEDVSFTMELGVTDLLFEAAAQGSTKYTLGDTEWGVRGTSDITPNNFFVLLTRNAKSQDSGTLGSAGFESLLIYNCQIQPTGDDAFTNRAEGKARYDVIADRVDVLPWITAFSGSNFSVSNGIVSPITSDNRVMFDTWVADGTEDDFEVAYTPISAAKTHVFNATSGAALTVSTVTPSTKNIVLSAAPTTGTICVCFYEFSAYV